MCLLLHDMSVRMNNGHFQSISSSAYWKNGRREPRQRCEKMLFHLCRGTWLWRNHGMKNSGGYYGIIPVYIMGNFM